eukprot:6537032-Alexandrium_andersonii.AAC.1
MTGCDEAAQPLPARCRQGFRSPPRLPLPICSTPEGQALRSMSSTCEVARIVRHANVIIVTLHAQLQHPR